MSKQPGRRSAPKRRPQARKGRAVVAAKSAGKRSDRTSWIIAAVVIAVGVALVFAFAGGSHNTGSGAITGDQAAPASLVKAVTGVPQSVLNQVGTGTVTGLPGKLPGPLLTSGGKPRIVYIGAEYCPYCATERWAMVQAFSRFGTFKNLKITTSSSTDVDANTPTFSFHGATYTSDYIKFESVEEENNKSKPLEQPTAEQAQLAAEFDTAPYTSGGSTSGGTIPFIDIANEYIISGATYDVGVLQGQTHAEIGAALSDPTSAISQGAIGAANAMTAAVCKVTGNKPANVCTTSAITAIEAKLPTK
jgi:thiol-disulfide isomerase/thioredoxin